MWSHDGQPPQQPPVARGRAGACAGCAGSGIVAAPGMEEMNKLLGEITMLVEVLVEVLVDVVELWVIHSLKRSIHLVCPRHRAIMLT